MDIDWKVVSQSPGYISMKKAIADEAKRTAKWQRKPDERYQEAFEFAINRAKHYAYRLNKSIEDVLNYWEEARTYNFISYYTNHHLPKFDRIHLKQPGLKSIRKRSKKVWRHSKKMAQSEMLRAINFYQLQNSIRSKDKKSRWSNEHKKRNAYFRDKQSL